jgi:hypothetical protein
MRNVWKRGVALVPAMRLSMLATVRMRPVGLLHWSASIRERSSSVSSGSE